MLSEFFSFDGVLQLNSNQTPTMKSKSIPQLTLAFTTLAIAVFTSACATSGYKQADKTGAGIAEFRDEITNGKAAVDTTVASLGAIATSANTDPRKAFEQYSDDVKDLESTANKIRKRAQDMKEQGAKYFERWQAELATINNPDVRALAEQRKAKLQAAFDNIRTHSEPLKAAFDPWMSDLKDLQKYLSNDLTVNGVDAAKSLFTKAGAGGREVQKHMDALVAELNTVAAALTPAKVAAEAK